MKFNYAVLIFNPKSGQNNINASKIESQIEKISVRSAVYMLTEELNLKETIEKESNNGADLIVACGGDGTILSVAEAMYKKNIPLAVLPFGTANVFATELGISANSLELLKLIEQGRIKKRDVDMGLAGSRKFLLRLGIGWEAVMSKDTPEKLKKDIGKLSYLATAFNIRNNLKRSTYVIRTEKYTKKIKGIGCMICNSGNLGLPELKLLPGIHIDDGKLNIVIIKKSNTKAILGLLLNLLFYYSREKKTSFDDYILTTFPAEEIIIEQNPLQPAAVDGELINCSYPLKIKILQKALEVIVPDL